MAWKWVGIFSLTGLLMGLVTSLVGLYTPAEVVTWIGCYGVWGRVVFQDDLPRFTTPLLGSIGAGVLTGLTQYGLWSHYVDNNPWYAAELVGTSANLVEILRSSVEMGAGCGVLVGGVCWTITKVKARK
jgi:hypothetical protein